MKNRTVNRMLLCAALSAVGALAEEAEVKDRATLYLQTRAQMQKVAPPINRISGHISRIDFDLTPGSAASRGKLTPFWRTQIMADRWLATNWMLPASDPVFQLVDSVTGWTVTNVTRRLIAGDSASLVRILGGWNPNWENGEVFPGTKARDYDLAYRDEKGVIHYRWDLLHKRLAPVVSNGVKPFIVLDNVPYCFAPETESEGYGQANAPVNFDEWSRFIEALCRELIDRYGFDRVSTWRFRVGTEMDNTHHWEGGAPDSLEKYLKTYDYAADAVKRVLPRAEVGPGNFNSMFAGRIDRLVPPLKVFEHFASGTNYATGKIGSPVDFAAVSSYGIYWMGGKFDHPDAAAHGYEPGVIALHIDLLKRLRACSPRFADIPMEIQEFGLLHNMDDVISDEPGAFGAAWTASHYLLGVDQGVSRFFHWQDREHIGGQTLLFSSAWVRVMLEKTAGGEAFIPKIQLASGDSFLNAMAVRKDGRLYVMISCFNTGPESDREERIELHLPVSEPVQIRQAQYSAQTAPYDAMVADLKNAGELTGRINALRAMASPAGVSKITADVAKYVQIQKDSFQMTPFAGTVSSDGSSIHLSLSAPTPSVTVLELIAP